MDFETAKAAIDFLYDHSTLSNSVSFAFYGGEPLIAFPLIKQPDKEADLKLDPNIYAELFDFFIAWMACAELLKTNIINKL